MHIPLWLTSLSLIIPEGLKNLLTPESMRNMYMYTHTITTLSATAFQVFTAFTAIFGNYST